MDSVPARGDAVIVCTIIGDLVKYRPVTFQLLMSGPMTGQLVFLLRVTSVADFIRMIEPYEYNKASTRNNRSKCPTNRYAVARAHHTYCRFFSAIFIRPITSL